MTWIKTIPYDEAAGRLKTLYDRIRAPDGQIDNIMAAHSLRAHTMDGHMALYKNVLHHGANETPKWFLEAIGVYVSLLNKCAYCADHHSAGMARLIGDDVRSAGIRAALEAGTPEQAFEGAELAAMRYAEALTTDPSSASKTHVEALRLAGCSDGEILELNQVTAYFAYANRTVLGLGVNTQGEVLGLSPGDSDDTENWTHS